MVPMFLRSVFALRFLFFKEGAQMDSLIICYCQKKSPALYKTGSYLLGGAWGIRTPDLNIANVARYQLC